VILGVRIPLLADARLSVDRVELPPLRRLADAAFEPALLLLGADREPVLDELDSGGDGEMLERGA